MACDAKATKTVKVVTFFADDIDCEADEAEADNRKMVSYIDYCPHYGDN